MKYVSEYLEKTGVQEKLAVKAPVIVEKPFAEEPVQLKIPVNKKNTYVVTK